MQISMSFVYHMLHTAAFITHCLFIMYPFISKLANLKTRFSISVGICMLFLLKTIFVSMFIKHVNIDFFPVPVVAVFFPCACRSGDYFTL
jgi:hypothetical protein